MFAHKGSLLQQLLSDDYPLRLDYAQTICFDSINEYGHLERTAISDECSFRTSEVVNKHITRAWSVKSPRDVQKVQLASGEAMVLRGMY